MTFTESKPRASWLLIAALLVGCNRAPTADAAPAHDQPAPAAPPSAAVAPAPAASAAAPPAAVSASPVCARMCRVGQRLKCGASDELCQTACASMTRGVCAKELGATLECFAKQPVDHWECGPEGLPAVKSGFCDTEQAAAVDCARRSSAL